MKNLFIASALIEGSTGLILVIAPPTLTSILLGSTLDLPVGVTLARVAGLALLSLGIASWAARQERQSGSSVGLVTALTFYNVGIIALLFYTKIGLGISGIGFWPTILVHVIMAGWCSRHLLNKSQ